MCGIAGYFGTAKLPDERLSACLRLMHRRGPDHAAIYRHDASGGRNAVLLHSRLEIIDRDPRSHQPLRAGSKVLVYNGELYNYLELRAELAARGRRFETQSDTEVMLATLDVQGDAGLDRCEGMWAFALYDEESGTLRLCRDRFGEKPLYLYKDATGTYFGSEIKYLAALVGRRFDVNPAHLYRYLVNGYKSLYKTRETFFIGVSELPAGTLLTLNADGSESSRRYWEPKLGVESKMSYDDAVDGVRERLVRSVKLRLRADVPLAFCMSGGVDSNSLISIAKRLCNYDVHGFTVLSDDARYEEREQIEAAVRELGVRHTPVPIVPDRFRENMVELIRQHDAPIFTISYYLHWLLMKEVAASGYRISISGTAADELLTGYYDHHNLYLYEVRDLPEFRPALAGWQSHIAPLVRNPHLQKPRLYMETPGFRDHIYLNNDEFATYLTSGWHEDFSETRYHDSILRNRMLNELFHESVPVILHEDDLNAMYYSIENRSPFLDRELFEFCARIPSRHLMRDGYGKVVLRDAMRGIVPDAVLDNRRKVGFNAPVTEFLKIREPAVREYLLDKSPVFAHVRRDQIEKLLSKETLPNSESKFLFYFLNAKVFLEEFAA
jgi:asparagine synthase (glutamine-hydrolysing)